MSGYDDDQQDKPVVERLKSLMKFLKMEVKGAKRLSYVSEGFSETVKERTVKYKRVIGGHTSLPTGLLAAQPQKGACIFCDKSHESQATLMRSHAILDKRACLSCLKVGHMAKACKERTVKDVEQTAVV